MCIGSHSVRLKWSCASEKNREIKGLGFQRRSKVTSAGRGGDQIVNKQWTPRSHGGHGLN